MIDLHYWTTPNGHKITLFLEESGLAHRIIPVDIGAGEQFAPAFLAIAPNNRIPAIVDHAPADGGAPLSLFESGAILLYLADKTGQFIPTDLRGRAEVLHLVCMHYADGIPYQFEDRWISLEILPQAREADFSQSGPNEWLVAEIPFSDAEISFLAVPADETLAAHLGCRAGDALFQTERSTWWQGRAITFVRLCFRPGHRMTTRY